MRPRTAHVTASRPPHSTASQGRPSTTPEDGQLSELVDSEGDSPAAAFCDEGCLSGFEGGICVPPLVTPGSRGGGTSPPERRTHAAPCPRVRRGAAVALKSQAHPARTCGACGAGGPSLRRDGAIHDRRGCVKSRANTQPPPP